VADREVWSYTDLLAHVYRKDDASGVKGQKHDVGKEKNKLPPCTGTEVLYRPYGL
jgi:hypothetical protein